MYTAINLGGTWTVSGSDKPFTLPGGACENAFGTPCAEFDTLTQDAVRCLRPSYEYIGALKLEREIEIPESAADKDVSLFIERVNMTSALFIDGVQIGRAITELSVPHVHRLPLGITGRHTLTLMLDNRDCLNIDKMASGYSPDTQSIWIGAVGKVELRIEERVRIDDVQVFPKDGGVDLRISALSECRCPNDRLPVKLRVWAVAPDGTKSAEQEYSAVLFNRRQVLHFGYDLSGEIEYWSEFNPVLYTLYAVMEHEGGESVYSVKFGMRSVQSCGRQLLINGKPLSLRGTLDCGIYPMTGYPPTDRATWDKTMRTVKEYGLNHVRFHAWCPPEAAFAAADEAGVYVSAEMPLWLNYDVCALETGDDLMHRQYFMQEALNISKTYGNHPSFIMFSNGNENMGDFELLEDITSMIKARDPRRLYTMTSNFDHPVSPCEDYLCAFEVGGKRIRIQVFHDVVSEHSRLDYNDAINGVPVPSVSFEVGQYCVYPDTDSIADYTGNLVPLNFKVIEKDMREKGVHRYLKRYVKASGKLAALLYKEDIEVALRTHGMGGFELLGLSDYTGQCTATVGLLDVFWNSKGLVTPEEFRRFCSDFVPLLKTERVFKNTEVLHADFDVYDFRESPASLDGAEFTLTLRDGDTVVKEIKTTDTHVDLPLDFIERPTKLDAVLAVCGRENGMSIFVYPDTDSECSVDIIYTIDELKAASEKGGAVLFDLKKAALKNPIEGLFKPVFWSPAYFVSDRACGMYCDKEHPVFELFPTEDYAEFQWKHPVDNSVSADISVLDEGFEPILEPVPNFYNNIRRSPLFEARIGKAKVLFCGFDFGIGKTAVRALKRAVYEYVGSAAFEPTQAISLSDVEKLLK